MIKQIVEDPNPFRLLVNSICPGIYGHELVKAGLVLAVMGAFTWQAVPHLVKVVCAKWQKRNPYQYVETFTFLWWGIQDLEKVKCFKYECSCRPMNDHSFQAVTQASPRGVFVCGSWQVLRVSISHSGLFVLTVVLIMPGP